jgi:Nicotinamide mononucleotide transporter
LGQTKLLLRQLVHSKNLDLFGALLIFGVCYVRDFHETIFFQGKIQYGIAFSDLWSFVKKGAFPLGILSTAGAVVSMLSTRLTGKQSNWGNIIGLLTTINSGVADYLFGNHSAIITYPLTFLIYTFAVKNWAKGEKVRDLDLRYYLIMTSGIVIGFVLVYLGAHLFGGRNEDGFLIVVAVTFGLSVGANFCNALKYKETWLSWMLYNIVQLTKNAMINNIANVVKYIFYMFNAVITWFDWRLNGDVEVSGKS